jgi:hypothetical protein
MRTVLTETEATMFDRRGCREEHLKVRAILAVSDDGGRRLAFTGISVNDGLGVLDYKTAVCARHLSRHSLLPPSLSPNSQSRDLPPPALATALPDFL